MGEKGLHGNCCGGWKIIFFIFRQLEYWKNCDINLNSHLLFHKEPSKHLKQEFSKLFSIIADDRAEKVREKDNEAILLGWKFYCLLTLFWVRRDLKTIPFYNNLFLFWSHIWCALLFWIHTSLLLIMTLVDAFHFDMS